MNRIANMTKALNWSALTAKRAGPSRELPANMLRLYPDHVHPGSLWSGAHVAKERKS
jgi:hypothetical protein